MMKWYRELITRAPDDLKWLVCFYHRSACAAFSRESSFEKDVCAVVWTWTGDPQRGEETFKPIRAFKKAALDLVGPLPQPALQSMFDGLYPAGVAMVLAGGLCEGTQRRSDCATC